MLRRGGVVVKRGVNVLLRSLIPPPPPLFWGVSKGGRRGEMWGGVGEGMEMGMGSGTF